MPFRTRRVSTGCRPGAYADGSEEDASSPFPLCIYSKIGLLEGEKEYGIILPLKESLYQMAYLYPQVWVERLFL
jgi:hypothetical protein